MNRTKIRNAAVSSPGERPCSSGGEAESVAERVGMDTQKLHEGKGKKNKKAKLTNFLATGDVRPDGPSSGDAKVESVPEPVGMQIYWNLSSVDANVREAASAALVRELVGAQRDYEDKGLGKEEKAAEAVILGAAKTQEDGLKDCAPGVQYALRRLVRGVASSRESARQGFALALTVVLEALPCIDVEAVMKVIQKHLEVTSSMKGQESRDALLGQLFAYAALMRSSRLIGEASKHEPQELSKEMTQQLLTLAKKKIFLREPAIFVLVEFMKKLDSSGFQNGVCSSPLLLESLKQEPDSFSPDILFLVLEVREKLPKPILQSCSLIPDSGNLIDIFKKDQLLRFVPCLKESSNSHPRVHSVWGSLLEILFADNLPPKSRKNKKRSSDGRADLETRLVTFWSIVVDESLLTSSHERKHLAMQLLLLVLTRLPAPSHIQFVLSKNFVQCLLDASASKENLLYKVAQSCITEVCKWAAGDEDRCVRTMIALQNCSQGRFDQLTKTQSIKGLMTYVNTIEGYQSTFQGLAGRYLSGKALGDDHVDTTQSNKKQKSPTEDMEDGGNDIMGDSDVPPRWVVDQLRALCQQALVGLPAGVAIQELVAKLVPLLTPVQPLTGDEEEAVAALRSTMCQVSAALSQVEAGEQQDRLQAMLSLLVQLLFESRLVPSIAVQTASEISILCKKAFGDLVTLEVELDPEDGDSPVFMDVLVDLLLSLLARSCAPIRAAADQVFKSFSGDLTSSGLTDLLRIIKKNTYRSRHKPLVEVEEMDDDDDILDEEESDEDSPEENDDGDVDEDGVDESENDNEDVRSVSDSVKLPSKRKQDDLGAVTGDDEDDEDVEDNEGTDDEDGESVVSDLDDETMFRMDKQLANILKQRKRGGAGGAEDSKDSQIELMHFKFRVLSLLDFFLQKHSGSMLVLTMLPSLLHVFVNSCATNGNTMVADRVSSILQNKLFKGKKYPKGPEVDQSNLKDLLKKALKLASRSTIKRVAVMAQGACLWILKVINGNLVQENDEDLEEMFSAALEDFFVHKKCRLPPPFFKEIFTRYPWIGNSLLGSLLQKCTTARSPCLRIQSLRLVAMVLRLKTGKSAKKSAKKFKRLASDLSSATLGKSLEPHLPSLSKVVIHYLKEAPSVISRHRIEPLQFCVSALELYRTTYPGRSLGEFINAAEFSSALGQLSAPAKSKLSYILLKLGNLEEKSRIAAGPSAVLSKDPEVKMEVVTRSSVRGSLAKRGLATVT